MEIEHNKRDARFQTKVEGGLAFVEYILENNIMTLTHTEVPPNAEGRGVAAAVVTAALDHARAETWKVRPVCAYVVSFLKRHPRYDDIVTQAP